VFLLRCCGREHDLCIRIVASGHGDQPYSNDNMFALLDELITEEATLVTKLTYFHVVLRKHEFDLVSDEPPSCIDDCSTKRE
jgi:hypothetical protein